MKTRKANSVRLLLSVLLFVMVLCVFQVSAMAEHSITIKAAKVKAKAEQDVSIPITLPVNNGWAAIQFIVKYNSSILTYKNYSDDSSVPLTVNGDESGFIYINGSNRTNVNENGLVTVSFKVKNTDAEGTYPITLISEDLSYIDENSRKQPVEPNLDNGEIRIFKYQEVTGLTINEHSATLDAGETLKLYAKVEPDDATTKSVTWKTTDKLIASVSDGVVTAVDGGTVTITAVSDDNNNITDSCVVTVNVPVTGIQFVNESVQVEKDEAILLETTIAPSNATNKALRWTSSNPDVAIVNEGTVTGLMGGTATITVATEDGGFIAFCNVVVTESVESVSLNNSSVIMRCGDTNQPSEPMSITATVYPITATNKAVNWSSSDDSIATVSKGVITAVKTGVVTITVASSENPSLNATCEVSVVKLGDVDGNGKITASDAMYISMKAARMKTPDIPWWY